MKPKTKYIYVVDDNRVNLKLLKYELNVLLGYEVKAFATAKECLAAIVKDKPELVLSDYYLDSFYNRDKNGDELLDRIKSLYPDVPVIIYSSRHDVDLIVNLLKNGAETFIYRDEQFLNKLIDETKVQLKINKGTSRAKIAMACFFALLIALCVGWLIVDFSKEALLMLAIVVIPGMYIYQLQVRLLTKKMKL